MDYYVRNINKSNMLIYNDLFFVVLGVYFIILNFKKGIEEVRYMRRNFYIYYFCLLFLVMFIRISLLD